MTEAGARSAVPSKRLKTLALMLCWWAFPGFLQGNDMIRSLVCSVEGGRAGQGGEGRGRKPS